MASRLVLFVVAYARKQNENPILGGAMPHNWRGRVVNGALLVDVSDYFGQTLAESIEMARYDGLTGKGFIVLEAPNCNFVEHDTLQDAQGYAAIQASRVGCAIVYAPVAIVRPRVQVDITAPEVLKTLRGLLPSGDDETGDGGEVKVPRGKSGK